ncbi:predicted protein [Plenodomus lingam JN3]|uniref:Predicted protein n=1 Tax=Leptosphaeria maculans (strain JN3 / isolate v23.1.3 / race Av1-4-5-6-7-8) TaxID=985895 RepID=E4ZRL8_LEPMJ|nr:predicted protein [Plenodomus lingam JN3]CBX93865.1 predicted protein [Plenodomus lingam JN3]
MDGRPAPPPDQDHKRSRPRFPDDLDRYAHHDVHIDHQLTRVTMCDLVCIKRRVNRMAIRMIAAGIMQMKKFLDIHGVE